MSRVVQPIVAGVWSTDSVRDVAEQLGITNLSDDFLTAAAADVEYRLHEVVEEATKFMRHARRTKLKVEDVELAMKARNMEPVWGFSAPNQLSFRKTQTPTGTVYFYDDEEIDLTRIYKTQLPPAPRDVSYTAHWLAVEGVQPAIPQNPSAAELQALTQPHASTSTANATGSVDVRPLVKHVLSRELQQYFDRFTQAAEDSERHMREAAVNCLRADTGLADLVPYLVQWISERVVANLTTDLSNVQMMLDLIKAMLDNPTLFVEPYLHQLIPSILSILLTTDLAPSIDPEPNQLYIRDYASQLLARILTTYAGAYISLQPRVLKTLLTGLSGKGDLYGAIRGLTALSREAVLSTLGKAQNLRALDAMLSGRDDERRDRIIEIVLEALQTAFAATPLSTAEVEELADAEAVTKWGSTLASEIQSRPGLALSLLALETAPDTLLAMPAVEVEAPSMRASTSAEESGMDVES